MLLSNLLRIFNEAIQEFDTICALSPWMWDDVPILQKLCSISQVMGVGAEVTEEEVEGMGGTGVEVSKLYTQIELVNVL